MRGCGIAWLLVALSAPAQTVHVVNLYGDITVRTAAGAGVRVVPAVAGRVPEESELETIGSQNRIYVRAQPAGEVRMDLEVTVPYRTPVIVQAKAGRIRAEGFFPALDVFTESGAVEIAAPWEVTPLLVQSWKEPAAFVTPPEVRFSARMTGEGDQRRWVVTDRIPHRETYGSVRVTAERPGRLELVSLPIPADSPVKLPRQAPEILEEILSGAGRARPEARESPEAAASGGELVFRSDVRIVNLHVAVFGRDGLPFGGLQPEDFEVIEDGVPQRVSVAVSEEAPFNLALLVDLSGSTRRDREAIQEAASRFVGIARPQDRVALYALGNNQFHVLAPLSGDHQRVAAQARALPNVAGGSPIYDTIVLGYAQELRQRPGERNALILISDGIDNQLHQQGLESKVSFDKLRRAAAWMDVLIYPVFLDPYDVVPAPAWAKRARERLEELARDTGGRLFPARSVKDLEPVYPEVAQEMRSLYSVAYYPKNQEFGGEWRKVEVRVKQPGARVRTRLGYYAR